MRFFRKALTFSVALFCVCRAAAAEPTSVSVGFVENTETDFVPSTIEPLVVALSKALPGTVIRIERISSSTLESDVALRRPDLFIAPVSAVVQLMDRQPVHVAATRKTELAKDPNHSIGGTIIVRRDRPDIRTLADLRGKTLAATMPDSLGGWLALCNELGITPQNAQKYFGEVAFLGSGFPWVFSGVLSGRFDAGIIPSCLLERIISDGLLEEGALRTVGDRSDDLLACRHSTALFPDIAAVTFSYTPPEVAKAMTLALLTENTNDGYSWQVSSDFHAIRALQQKLHLGAWAFLNDRSLKTLWNRYHEWVLAVLAVLTLLILNEFRLRSQVRRKTLELQESFAERDRLRSSEEQSRGKIKTLEHISAINQLCAMIAHELKQPVASVINYTAILRLKLQNLGRPDPVIEKALGGSEREARRIATIVDRVRSYAKKDRSEHEPVNLGQALQAALREAAPIVHVPVHVSPMPLPQDLTVSGHALEIELLFLNILKNAGEALDVANAPAEPKIHVILDHGSGEASVTIADNGPRLTPEQFEKMKSVSESIKPEGLGLGLAIVRNIADEHGARLTVRQLEPRGIAVTVSFDLIDRAQNPSKESFS